MVKHNKSFYFVQ